MSDPMFDIYRKASESWVKMQQELFQQTAPPSLFAAAPGPGAAPEWARNAQKTWIDLTAEILDRQRESVDGLYKSAIHLFHQTAEVPKAKSSEDHRGAAGVSRSKASRAGQKPGSETSRRSRHVAGKRSGR